MRLLLFILVVTLVLLQHKLWLGDDSLIQYIRLEKNLMAKAEENQQLAARNRILEADIKELKNGDQALEDQARYELGMIKEGEVFYQFME